MGAYETNKKKNHVFGYSFSRLFLLFSYLKLSITCPKIPTFITVSGNSNDSYQKRLTWSLLQ